MTLLLVGLGLLLWGCASSVPPTVFAPKGGSQVRMYYANGHAIGAVRADSTFVLAELEPEPVGNNVYLRLWMLWENRAHTTFLLEPLKAVTLRKEDVASGQVSAPAAPYSPTKILATLSNEQAMSTISQGIGGALLALTVQPTTATTVSHGTSSSGESANARSQTTVNDAPEKAAAVLAGTQASMENTNTWYEVYKTSINNGVLRKTTLFPGQSVNGYVYFATGATSDDFERFSRDRKHAYTVTVTTPSGSVEIRFDPTEGE